MSEGSYSGTVNLEIMDGATNYIAWLTGFVDQLGREARTRTLLDFGAGIGTYPRKARSLGYRVRCVELDDAQRQLLQEDGFDAVRSLDQLPEGSCEAVYCLNVIEHIPDDSAALRALWRVTAPGGHLLVVVPAFQMLFNNNDRLVGHVRRYGRRELLERLRSTDWVVDRCRYGDCLGFAAALAYRLLGRHVDGVLKPGQINLYDRWLFPASRRLDAVFGPLLGKNLVVFAHRRGPAGAPDGN